MTATDRSPVGHLWRALGAVLLLFVVWQALRRRKELRYAQP